MSRSARPRPGRAATAIFSRSGPGKRESVISLPRQPLSFGGYRTAKFPSTWSPASLPGRRSRNGSPTTNRISTGSTVPGIHQARPLKTSTKAPPGNQRKSPSAMAEPWFSISPEALKRQKKPLPKILGTAARKAMLATNDFRSEISRFRQIPANSGGFLAKAPSTDAPQHRECPLFPRNPLFPALRSSPTPASEASRQKQIPSRHRAVEHRTGRRKSVHRNNGLAAHGVRRQRPEKPGCRGNHLVGGGRRRRCEGYVHV